MTPVALGALAGAVGGAGGWLIVRGVRVPPTSLADRVGPFVAGLPAPFARRDVHGPFSALHRIAAVGLRDAGRRLDGWLGGVASLRQRLLRAGLDSTVEDFRVEQLVWGVCGLLLGVVTSVCLVAGGGTPSAVAVLLLVLGLGLGGVLARDRYLSMQVGRREERILAEFPTIAELIALAVTAGEGAAGAMERVCRVANGELSRELRIVLGESRTGVPLVEALSNLAGRTTLPVLGRFVDGLVIAIERGTPLAEVLRAQAGDVRAAGQRALLEAGGKREIAMLLPVVFLLLPVTIVFALFPGFYGFQLLAP